MAKMPTNAALFAKRGDPWVSQREGREKFGRNIERENPDVDCHLFADKVKADTRKSVGGVVVSKAKPVGKLAKSDDRRVKANKGILLNQQILKEKEAKRVKSIIKEHRRYRRVTQAVLDASDNRSTE